MQALVANLELLAKRDLSGLAPPVRRRRRRSRRHDRRNPHAQSQAGSRLRLDHGAAGRAGRVRARGAGRHMAGRAQFRHLAESAHQSALLRAGLEDDAQRKGQAYIADCLQTATWLVRALDQRAKTILKVSSEIVRQQDGFFAKGVQHLRPLNLKTVADAISMHESTVSRVTANKYMATSARHLRTEIFLHVVDRGGRRRRSAFRRSGAPPHPSADRRRERGRHVCPTTRSWKSCAAPASISRAGRSPNIAKPCASRLRCSVGAKN